MDNTIYYHFLSSPIGPLLLAGSDEKLVAIGFSAERGSRLPQPEWCEDAGAFCETILQLEEYFAGGRQCFSIPFSLNGSRFQRAVWQAMLDIPYGRTRTYGELAVEIDGDVAASRAVGVACGENPLPIIVPCHRVIGAGGSLTGFGGGLATKRFLLDLEFRTEPPADTLFAFADRR